MKVACFENFSPIAETAMLKKDSAFLNSLKRSTFYRIKVVEKYTKFMPVNNVFFDHD